MEFPRQAERFAVARRCLMLPHPEGVAESIAKAFEACAIGLRSFHRGALDQNAGAWLQRIEALMDISGITGADERERRLTRAAQLTTDEQADLSRLVDELAHWFERK
jgi:hypothetical protein